MLPIHLSNTTLYIVKRKHSVIYVVTEGKYKYVDLSISYIMPKFKDPKTGQIVNVDNFLVFLSSLLFGLFFFLYIGETQHALVMVGFAILITLVGIFVSPIAILYAYVFPLIYSFIAPKIVKDKWLNKGFVELQEYPESNNYINEKAIEIKEENKSLYKEFLYKELSIEEKEAIARENKKAIMVIVYNWIPVIILPLVLFVFSLI